MAKNKIIYGGTTLIDLTDATAVASDVAAGKYFYGNDGVKTEGTSTFDSDTTDANALGSEILSGRTAYVNKQKITGSMTNNGAVSGTISTKAGTYTVPQGFHDGSGTVQISSTEQAKIIPSNIKSGVEILGVEGNYTGEGVTAQSKTVTPSTSQQTVLPDSGYDYLSQVTVNAIAYTETDNSAGGKTVTIGTAAS